MFNPKSTIPKPTAIVYIKQPTQNPKHKLQEKNLLITPMFVSLKKLNQLLLITEFVIPKHKSKKIKYSIKKT